MTDVGSVSVGVVVHGDGLGAKLAATIRAAVLPVIRDLNKELAASKKQADQIDGRGYLKLTAAAREAAVAVRAVGHAHKEVTREANISHLKQIEYYDKVADAAERSAQRQIDAAIAVGAANAAAAAGPEPGRDRTGGSFGHAGGRRQGGFLGAVLSPVGLNAIAALSTLAKPAALGVAELTRSIVDLAAAGLAIPSIIAGIGSSVTTLTIALSGTGDAFKAMWKAASTGDAKDLEKANKALAVLAPNAQSALKAIQGFFPAIQSLQRELQNDVFAGLDTSIKNFITRALPTFKAGTKDIANAWNDTIKTLLDIGGSDSTQGFFSKIFGNTAQAQRQLNQAIAPLIHGFGVLTSEGSDFLPRLADGITKLATRFDNFITKAAGDGRLDKWIDRGFTAFSNLGESLLNVGKIITDITSALGGGDTFLGWLEKATGKLHDFLSSAEGQEKLTKFFDDARAKWKEWQPILKDLVHIIGDVIKGVVEWGNIILPVIGQISNVLEKMPGLVSGVVIAFLGFKTLGGIFGPLLGGIDSLGGKIDGLPGRAGRAMSGLKKSLALLGGGLAIDGLLNNFGRDGGPDGRGKAGASWGDAAKTIGGGALIGAQFGGIPGAVIGAAAGAIATAIVDYVDKRKAADSDAAKTQQEIDAAQLPRGVGHGILSQPDIEEQNRLYQEYLRRRGTIGPNENIFTPGAFANNFSNPNWLNGMAVEAIKNAIPAGGSIPGLDGKPITAENFDTEFPHLIENARLAQQAIDQLGDAVKTLPSGSIEITNPTPEILKQIEDLGLKVRTLPTGNLVIDANTDIANNKMQNFINSWKNYVIGVQVQPTTPNVSTLPGLLNPGGLPMPPTGPPRAAGGVIPGYSPGVDDTLVPLSGGEGIIIPEAMKALGPRWLYQLNSAFRGGISTSGYASGGVFRGGFDQGGLVDDEWKRKMQEALNGAGLGNLPAVQAPSIGLPSAGPITPTVSNNYDLGLAPTPNVNAAPGFQASQNLTDLTTGIQDAASDAVMGTIDAVQHPIDTLKAMAPLVGLGGDGAPGIGESWTNLGKGLVNWDQWDDNPWAAAGGAGVNIGSLIWGGRSLPGQISRGSGRLASRLGDMVPTPFTPETRPGFGLPAHEWAPVYTDDLAERLIANNVALMQQQVGINLELAQLRSAMSAAAPIDPLGHAGLPTGLFDRNRAYVGHNIPLSPENLYRSLSMDNPSLRGLFDENGVMQGRGSGWTGSELSFMPGYPLHQYTQGSNVILEGDARMGALGADAFPNASREAQRSGYQFVNQLNLDDVMSGNTPLRVWVRQAAEDGSLPDVWESIFDSFPTSQLPPMPDIIQQQVADILSLNKAKFGDARMSFDFAGGNILSASSFYDIQKSLTSGNITDPQKIQDFLASLGDKMRAEDMAMSPAEMISELIKAPIGVNPALYLKSTLMGRADVANPELNFLSEEIRAELNAKVASIRPQLDLIKQHGHAGTYDYGIQGDPPPGLEDAWDVYNNMIESDLVGDTLSALSSVWKYVPYRDDIVEAMTHLPAGEDLMDFLLRGWDPRTGRSRRDGPMDVFPPSTVASASSMIPTAASSDPSSVARMRASLGTGQSWDTPGGYDALKELLAKGDAAMPWDLPEMKISSEDSWARQWSVSESYAAFRNSFRDGAQAAFQGNFPWDKRDFHVDTPFYDLDLAMREAARTGDFSSLADPEWQKSAFNVGAIQAHNMLRNQLPGEDPLFRGMTFPASEMGNLTPGNILSWPLVSTSSDIMDARAFSGATDPLTQQMREGVMGGSSAARQLWMDPTEQQRLADKLALGDQPVVFEVAPGALSLPGSGERITSGQMEVVEVRPPDAPGGPTHVLVRQLHPGFASGGLLPGYSPGVDNMLVPLSGGEGIIIPEAMRALGADWLYDLNSMYRGGISKQSYASGGVYRGGFDEGGITPHLGTEAAPGPDDTSVLGVLIQIRNLLAGGGGASTPLNQMASSTAAMSGALGGPAGSASGGMGTWADGTPRNPGYEMASAAISALGGDPLKFLGPNPSIPQMGGYGAGGGYAAGGAALPVDALKRFAMSGNTQDLLGTGLDAADPVVSAIAAARNKTKGALGGNEIASLIDQIVGGGVYTGVMDASNSTLIGALQRYHDKGMKAAGAAYGGVPAGGAAAGLIQLAQSGSGGQYSWGASDLTAGLTDCSGAISDLVEYLTKGRVEEGRLFSTSDAASVLPTLGAVPGLIPGTLQIGFSGSHMAATLPNGVNFESGGGNGQGATYGGTAVGANDPQFTNQFSLPVNGVIPGAYAGMAGGANPLGYGGSPVPVYIVSGPGGGGMDLGGLLSGPMSAIGGVTGDVGNDALRAILGVGNRPLPNDPASVSKLLNEGNLAGLGALFGYQIGDYNRTGGAGDPVMTNDMKFTPDGALISDTGALSDRTFTSTEAAKDARQQQLLDLTAQMRDQLSDQFLTPVLEKGVAGGISAIDPSQAMAIGQAIGTAAAPPIAAAVAQAVASAMPSGSGGGTAIPAVPTPAPTTPVPPGMALGGAVIGPGTGTSDSILARLSHGEYVVPASDVRRAGGFRGMDAWRKSLPGFATGGGVIGNATVGGDFFGASEVPILGALLNFLVALLLKFLGVQIEVRDTLDETSEDIRSFRGDFQKFDATGRLMNDTSGLVDRSGSSSQEAADERIRILKIVIESLVKFIIEKIVVPIGKAVANAAIQAGGAAAGAAINSQAPGAGSIVSSLITSAGSAGVDIAADLYSQFAVSLTEVLADLIGNAIQGLLPNLSNAVFGGGALAAIFDPITRGLSGLVGMVTTLFGSVFGSVFDEGGIAAGIGVIPKATIKPERVLSPRQTGLFENFVTALERGAQARSADGNRTIQINAPIYMQGGGPETARQIRNELLSLMS